MTGAEMLASLSPVLRSLVDDLAREAGDRLAKRADAIAAEASACLDHGLALQVATPLDALEPLTTAVALGSDEAMTWLGLTYIEAAPRAEGSDADELLLTGVGWLETAMMAGEYHARAWFPEALRNLSPALLARWHALPPHSQTVVN